VKFAFHVRHDPEHVFEATMADDYETCINELARELTMYADEERWNIVISPAKRRRKKQMMFYRPRDEV
jgi:hypothetical protein